MPAGRGRRRQLATVVVVVGAGVDEKLNKIWKITKAGRKEGKEAQREREGEEETLARWRPKSVGPRRVGGRSVGRPLRRSVGRSVGHAIHTHSEVCAPCARNKFLLRPNIKNGRERERGRGLSRRGGGGSKNWKVVHIKTKLTFHPLRNRSNERNQSSFNSQRCRDS